MHYKQHYAHDQGNVNETARYVKREQPKKPQNNQNRGEHREHIVSSILILLLLSELCSAIQQPINCSRAHPFPCPWMSVENGGSSANRAIFPLESAVQRGT